MPLTVPLNTPDPELDLVGGKARGLGLLMAAGLPVPEGFCITVEAFEQFTAGLSLEAELEAIQQSADPDVAAAIRRRIAQADMPRELTEAIGSAYERLSNTTSNLPDGSDPAAVAVRSSATAEDLPGLSFAGQQASFLNVSGTEALLENIKGCWASLYSDSAIGYRARMGIAQDSVAMAVVVQHLLPAEAAGVLFTANPTSGARNEIIINANLGLGESVVSGTVTPDTYVIERDTGLLKTTEIGSKSVRTVPSNHGTETDPVPGDQQTRPAVAPESLTKLVELGLAAEAAAGQPQDVEWVMTGGEYYLVQSRPITNLPPEPLTDVQWQPPPGASRLFRRQVVENMSAPLCPLFEELYLQEGLDQGMDALMASLGLPMNLDDFVHRPMFVTANGYGYCRYDIKIGWHYLALIPKMLYFYVARLPGVIRTLIPRWQDEGLPAYQRIIDEWRARDLSTTDSATLIRGIRTLAHADAAYWGFITMMVGAAKISEAMLAWFLESRLVPGKLNSGAFLRGFPSMTLGAQESLAGMARNVRNMNEPLRLSLTRVPANRLLEALPDSEQGLALRRALENHLALYGNQIFDLDFVFATQAEQPEVVFTALQRLLAAASALPPTPQSLADERDALTEQTAQGLGPIRRWLFRKILGWAQTYGPCREAALFHMGAAWSVLRQFALTLGSRLVAGGALADAKDVFFLTSAELTEAAAVATTAQRRTELGQLASERVALREARKRLHPPGRVPVDVRFKVGPFDLTRFLETWETQKRNTEDAETLTGFAVSPGLVTGPACVIVSPADFQKMRPGHVLVCPTTTPAWTPLFADAVGLVTDIGAVLAHGSIVAREYGIPAVMGTGNGTERISDGDLLTVDGDSGVVSGFSQP